MPGIALSWHYAEGVASQIIGSVKASYVGDADNALKIYLSQDDATFLEELVPRPIAGMTTSNPKDRATFLDKKSRLTYNAIYGKFAMRLQKIRK